MRFIFLHYFLYMSKKFVNFVVVKLRRKMAFHKANNVTNVEFAVVTFRQQNKFL
jgi:hypothetical protein